MMQSFCVDERGRIISICPDDLSGCSDWLYADIDLTPMDDLTDINGVALYKYENGAIVLRSDEEREDDEHATEEPTVEE